MQPFLAPRSCAIFARAPLKLVNSVCLRSCTRTCCTSHPSLSIRLQKPPFGVHSLKKLDNKRENTRDQTSELEGALTRNCVSRRTIDVSNRFFPSYTNKKSRHTMADKVNVTGIIPTCFSSWLAIQRTLTGQQTLTTDVSLMTVLVFARFGPSCGFPE